MLLYTKNVVRKVQPEQLSNCGGSKEKIPKYKIELFPTNWSSTGPSISFLKKYDYYFFYPIGFSRALFFFQNTLCLDII